MTSLEFELISKAVDSDMWSMRRCTGEASGSRRATGLLFNSRASNPQPSAWLVNHTIQEFPKCGNLDCIICGSEGLRSRSPLINM